MSLASLYILIQFTRLHMEFFPSEIPLLHHEVFIIVASLVFFITSMKLKFKYGLAISLISILLGAFNLIGFTVMSVLYYKELYIDKFI